MADSRTPPGLLVAGALVLVGMGVASIYAERGGEDLRARMVALVDRSRARDADRARDREPAWGDATDGPAQDCYAAASRMLPAITNGLWNPGTERWCENGAPVTAERFAELRQQWSPAVAMLTDGAHCRDARPNRQFVDWHRLAWIVSAECASRLGEGRTTEAVQLCLDGSTLTLDGPLVVWGLTTHWTDARLAALPDSDLDLLAAGLARLDGRLSPMPDAERTLATYLGSLLDGSWARAGYPVNQRLAAWRHGFDAERWHLEAFDELVQIAAVLAPVAADGALRQQQWRAYRAAPRLRATGWSTGADRSVESVERQHCQELARLRLLRLAVAFHRRAPLPELADPFAAGALEVRLDGDTAVFRSAASFFERERWATRR